MGEVLILIFVILVSGAITALIDMSLGIVSHQNSLKWICHIVVHALQGAAILFAVQLLVHSWIG